MKIGKRNKIHHEFFIGQNMWTDGLILNQHYLHKVPSSVYLVVGVRDQKKKNNVLATCYFSSSGTGRWKEPFLELSRLVKVDGFKINLTQLISFGIKQLRKMKKYHLVISYADFSRNHHGGIYQAASWNFHGIRESNLCGLKIDGEFVHRRTLYTRYGTSSKNLKKRLENKGHEVELFYDKGKFLYWKTLDKSGNKIAEKMNLKSVPYQKPTVNRENVCEAPKEYRENQKQKRKGLF